MHGTHLSFLCDDNDEVNEIVLWMITGLKGNCNEEDCKNGQLIQVEIRINSLKLLNDGSIFHIVPMRKLQVN